MPPNEACGLLAGVAIRSTRSTAWKMRATARLNTSSSADGYRLLIELEEAGKLLGAFHSHPQSEAYPSPTDRRQAFWPIRYVIVVAQAQCSQTYVSSVLSGELAPAAAELGTVHEEQLEIVVMPPWTPGTGRALQPHL